MTPTEAKAQLSKYAAYPFRQFQESAIDFIHQSKKRFRILEAPTGSGKSLIAMDSGILAVDCTYMVHSKILQTQITTDFPEAKSLFGRSNYPCILDRSKNCAECISTKKKPCPVRDQCVYPIEKKKTLNHRLRILNYDYFLTETNHIGEFSGNPFSIVDEADNLENTLVNFISLSFTARSLERLGLEEGPARKTATCSGGLDAWREFAQEAILRAREIKSQLQKEIDAWFQIAEQWQVLKMKEADYYQNIITKATMFLENVDHSWLLEENKPNHEGRYPQGIKFIFRPLWITDKLAEEFLWKHSDTWVLMSASFLPMAINCKTLGIPIDEVDYMSMPSTFPVERRPIHIYPPKDNSNKPIYSNAYMTAKTAEKETPKLIEAIKTILDLHPNEKGLIHCVSFALGKTIVAHVNDPRLILHTSGDRQAVVDAFIASDGNSVLLSPSLERGISLEQDLCRFIIIAKCPYLYLGDKVVSQRVYSSSVGQEWYIANMLLSVLQMTGRGMRSEDDQCVTYIIDSNFEQAYQKKPLYLPKWWREGIVW